VTVHAQEYCLCGMYGSSQQWCTGGYQPIMQHQPSGITHLQPPAICHRSFAAYRPFCHLVIAAAAAEEDAESAAAKEAPLSLPSAAAMSMGSKRPAVLADGTYASQVRLGTGLSSTMCGFFPICLLQIAVWGVA
jgi:hypothetical protein